MTKRVVALFSLLVLLILIILLTEPFPNTVFPWNKKEAIGITLDWGGLAKLPEGAKITKVRKEGTMFSRTFVIEFKAPEDNIKNWIINSKRLKDNEPKTDQQVKTYEVYPGEEESMGGKVIIENEKVTIRMSWS